MNPRVWHVAGPSKQGKTLLLESLIPLLPGTVRVIKHSHHVMESDSEYADTARLHGALSTARIHPDGMVIRGGLTSPVQFFRWYGYDCDHMVVEGYKNLSTPKIWIGQQTSLAGTCKVLIGPQKPSPNSEIFWLPASLPLTPDSAQQLAVQLWDLKEFAAFEWDVWEKAWLVAGHSRFDVP